MAMWTPQKLNLVFSEDAFAAGDLFLKEINNGKIAGCVTWAPKTTEVVEQSGGKAHILATNRNLLIVADILIVNKGFAQANPDKVAGLVAGLLEGNRMVRDNQAAHLDLIGRAFKWDRAQTQAELAKVHFSNLPENLGVLLRRDRRGRQLRRHLPIGDLRLRQSADQRSGRCEQVRRFAASAEAGGVRRVCGSEGRDRADQDAAAPRPSKPIRS